MNEFKIKNLMYLITNWTLFFHYILVGKTLLIFDREAQRKFNTSSVVGLYSSRLRRGLQRVSHSRKSQQRHHRYIKNWWDKEQYMKPPSQISTRTHPVYLPYPRNPQQSHNHDSERDHPIFNIIGEIYPF